MKTKQGELIKAKITIVVECYSNEYENTDTILDELACDSWYEIGNTAAVTVTETEFRDIQLIN
jgi:hypothetical protein